MTQWAQLLASPAAAAVVGRSSWCCVDIDVEFAHYEFIRSGESMDDRSMQLIVR